MMRIRLSRFSFMASVAMRLLSDCTISLGSNEAPSTLPRGAGVSAQPAVSSSASTGARRRAAPPPGRGRLSFTPALRPASPGKTSSIVIPER